MLFIFFIVLTPWQPRAQEYGLAKQGINLWNSVYQLRQLSELKYLIFLNLKIIMVINIY